jgi:hypothetical protein
MLLQLRNFMQRMRIFSTQQLTREFGVDLPTLQPMLDFWIKKGMVELCLEASTCQSSCLGCKKKAPKFYQFVA